MKRLGLIAGIVAVHVACSSADMADVPDGDADETDATPSDTESDTDTAKPLPPPDGYWGLGATLVLAGGAVDPTSTVALHHDDGGVICDVAATISDAVADTEPVAGHVAWWTWTLDVADDAPCLWRGPTVVRLGIGPTDAQLDSAAARKGMVASTAYGLYFEQVPGVEPVIAGVAGTQEQLAGAGEAPVTTPPLPDATYQLVTLYGLPID